jgi:HAD superfamily hydrolase (TIGR01509 family)
MSNIKGFIFDMDGVLTDTEYVWSVAFREVCDDNGGAFTHEKKMAMIGMSTPEWSTYMAEHMGVCLSPLAIASAVEVRVLELYEEHLPLIPGSVNAVERLAESFRVAIASSSSLRIIEGAVRLMGIEDLLTAKVSSEEVLRGKPSPDVYIETVRRFGLEPSACAAIEDSSNGIRAAHAAGLTTLGFPHADFPATADALALCDRVLSSMDELTVDLVAGLR